MKERLAKKNKPQKKQSCPWNLLCTRIVNRQCQYFHTPHQIKLVTLFQKAYKNIHLIALHLGEETSPYLLEFPDLPICIEKELKGYCIVEGMIEEKIVHDKYLFSVEKVIGEIGQSDVEEYILAQHIFYDKYLPRDQINKLFRNKEIQRGLFFVKNGDPVIRQQHASELIRFRRRNHNRGLHNEIVYYTPRGEILYSQRKKIALSGVISAGNCFTPLRKEYPKMIVRQIQKQLQQQICRLGKHSMLIQDSIKRSEHNNILYHGYLLDWPNYYSQPIIQLQEKFGPVNLDNYVRAILLDNGCDLQQFQSNVIRQGKKISNSYKDRLLQEKEYRKDLTQLYTFSIDGPNTKVLDDALSIQRLSNSLFKVYLHIADLQLFIKKRMKLDRQAQERVQNTYFGKYQYSPIFPRQINKSISLAVAPCLSITLEFITGTEWEDLKPTSINFYQSIISIDKKYNQDKFHIELQSSQREEIMYIRRALDKMHMSTALEFIQMLKDRGHFCLQYKIQGIKNQIILKSDEIKQKQRRKQILQRQRKAQAKRILKQKMQKAKERKKSTTKTKIQIIDRQKQVDFQEHSVIKSQQQDILEIQKELSDLEKEQKIQQQMFKQDEKEIKQVDQKLEKEEEALSDDTDQQEKYILGKLDKNQLDSQTAIRAKNFLISLFNKIQKQFHCDSLKLIIKSFSAAIQALKKEGKILLSQYLNQVKITNKKYFQFMIQKPAKKNIQAKERQMQKGEKIYKEYKEKDNQKIFKKQKRKNKNICDQQKKQQKHQQQQKALDQKQTTREQENIKVQQDQRQIKKEQQIIQGNNNQLNIQQKQIEEKAQQSVSKELAKIQKENKKYQKRRQKERNNKQAKERRRKERQEKRNNIKNKEKKQQKHQQQKELNQKQTTRDQQSIFYQNNLDQNQNQKVQQDYRQIKKEQLKGDESQHFKKQEFKAHQTIQDQKQQLIQGNNNQLNIDIQSEQIEEKAQRSVSKELAKDQLIDGQENKDITKNVNLKQEKQKRRQNERNNKQAKERRKKERQEKRKNNKKNNKQQKIAELQANKQKYKKQQLLFSQQQDNQPIIKKVQKLNQEQIENIYQSINSLSSKPELLSSLMIWCLLMCVMFNQNQKLQRKTSKKEQDKTKLKQKQKQKQKGRNKKKERKKQRQKQIKHIQPESVKEMLFELAGQIVDLYVKDGEKISIAKNQYDKLPLYKKIQWTKPLRQYSSLQGQRILIKLTYILQDIQFCKTAKQLKKIKNQADELSGYVKQLHIYNKEKEVLEVKGSVNKEALMEIQRFKFAQAVVEGRGISEMRMLLLGGWQLGAWCPNIGRIVVKQGFTKQFDEVQARISVECLAPLNLQAKIIKRQKE